MNNRKFKVYSQIVSDLINIKGIITDDDPCLEYQLKLIRRWIRDVKEYKDWEPREFLGIKLEQIEMMLMLGYDDLIIDEIDADIRWWTKQITEVVNNER